MATQPELYVVLVGDVGSGKSTIVEKLTGTSNRSSMSFTSVTKSAEPVKSLDKTLVICDTPGANAAKDRFEHNLHIAYALNFMPVSLVLTIFKADTRIDTVLEKISNYHARFIPEEFPSELIGVCITHMDTVEWTKTEFLEMLKENQGIDAAICVDKFSTCEFLSSEIKLHVVETPQKLDIQNENFLFLFSITNNNQKVLKDVRKEVQKFELMIQNFYQRRDKTSMYEEQQKMDLTFEFQAWMFEEIKEAQKRLSANNNFEFDPSKKPQTASEAGHVANMTSQLRAILSDLRIDAMKYHKTADSNFRKCPHCGVVWTLIEGCTGTTTCGSVPITEPENWSTGEMSTFSFKWDNKEKTLVISESQKKASGQSKNIDKKHNGYGCSKDIAWDDMASVPMPADVNYNPASTSDVPIVNQELQGPSWKTVFDTAMKNLPKMKVTSVDDL